ncbi:MAG TPA: formyltetrahydrofolate deformylase [Vampirovibrionales bacterium]
MTSPTKAILLLSCKDQTGLVARISGFLYKNGGNVIALDQHVDAEEEMFFMRVEWSLESFSIPWEQLYSEFEKFAAPFNAQWQIAFRGAAKPKVAIMVSKYSHCLIDLLWRKEAGEIDCEFVVMVSNHPDFEKVAIQNNIDFKHVPITKETKKEKEKEEIKIFKEYGVDLIVLARYMQILTEDFISEFPSRIINIHHSFLPAFIGGSPYKQAQERGVKIIGATSHYATSDLDEGPIIEQDILRISHRDSVNDLVCKGRDLERMVLARAVKLHLEHRVLVYGRKTIVFDS